MSLKGRLKVVGKKIDDYFFGDVDYSLNVRVWFYSFMIGVPVVSLIAKILTLFIN